ncbi:MAG: hypothetical protein IT169_06880 [Bryobacterales bacterium]|nr:hypothetical protein [Bryobacterales bacterium]
MTPAPFGMRYAERESMRVLAAIAVYFLLACPALHGQDAPAKGASETVVVLKSTVTIPANDLRRVRLPRVRAGAILTVQFQVEPGPAAAGEAPGVPRTDALEVEILRREMGNWRRSHLRPVQPSLVATQGELRFRIEDEREYLVVVRQAGDAKSPVQAAFQIELRGPAGTLVPSVRTLSKEKRTAVTVFSLGFLWTALMVCGVPIIRAFRSRRTPPLPPWYA